MSSNSALFYRLLFFLRPPIDIAEEIVECWAREWRKFGLFGEVVPAHRLHFTVAHVKDFVAYPVVEIAKALKAGERFALSASPIELVLERLFSLGIDDNRPAVLGGWRGVAGVNATKRSLLPILRDVGLEYARELKSAAHMTLQYENRLIIDQRIDPIRWRCCDLFLINSLVGLKQHDVLGQWSLKGPDQLSLGL
jgi:RNA 2',3'-cyclic 3'-phosphodiesterase